MYTEIPPARLVSVTDVEKFGANNTEKFSLILKKTTTNQMEEVIETWYAVTVFPREGKNNREMFLPYLEKIVKTKVKIFSNTWTKEGKIGYITNMNFIGIELVANTFKKAATEKKPEVKEESETEAESSASETIADDLPF